MSVRARLKHSDDYEAEETDKKKGLIGWFGVM